MIPAMARPPLRRAVLVPLLVCLGAGAAAGPRTQDERALERFLERARAARDARQAELAVTVEALVGRLEGDPRPGRAALSDIRRELDGLGQEAAAVLLPHLEPGAKPTAPQTFRAEEVTAALVRMRPQGVVSDLIRLSSGTGSSAGRLHAIEVLGAVPESERASRHLAALYESSTGPFRLASIVGLAAQADASAAPTLRAAVADDDPAVVRAVLAALADARNTEAAPAVLALTKKPAAAAPVAHELVGYWRACPELADAEVLDALLGLTLRTDVDTDQRIAILDALPTFEDVDARAVKRRLDPVLQSSDALLREAGLVCATLLGDRTARRELLSSFDQVVDETPDWWKGYQQRGQILLRIRAYTDAARDFKEAIELLEGRSRQSTYRALWIDLARCHVLSGKLGRAAETLDEMGLTRSIKEDLRADPDFRPLVEHARYGRVFE
jgi:tetratricopeptide (TPR) repeat protein